MNLTPADLAQGPIVSVDGSWMRHVPARYIDTALEGRKAPSRWGTGDAFPLLHLGRPQDSVIVEAYRHLVDPVDDPLMKAQIAPRRVVTCDVDVTNIYDLRTGSGRLSAGLSLEALQSATNDEDAYAECRQVAAMLHQLGLHGLVAPAATQVGETLVLFPYNLPASEAPRRRRDELWDRLPPDPRQTVVSGASLRVVRGPEDRRPHQAHD